MLCLFDHGSRQENEISCGLLLYATIDDNGYLTFPECPKAARHLGISPQLKSWIQQTSTKQFRGKAKSQDHFI